MSITGFGYVTRHKTVKTDLRFKRWTFWRAMLCLWYLGFWIKVPENLGMKGDRIRRSHGCIEIHIYSFHSRILYDFDFRLPAVAWGDGRLIFADIRDFPLERSVPIGYSEYSWDFNSAPRRWKRPMAATQDLLQALIRADHFSQGLGSARHAPAQVLQKDL